MVTIKAFAKKLVLEKLYSSLYLHYGNSCTLNAPECLYDFQYAGEVKVFITIDTKYLDLGLLEDTCLQYATLFVQLSDGAQYEKVTGSKRLHLRTRNKSLQSFSRNQVNKPLVLEEPIERELSDYETLEAWESM